MSFSSAVPSARGSCARLRRLVFAGAVPLAALSLAGAELGCRSFHRGTEGGGGKPAAKQAIAFDETGTIELQPTELHALHLTTAPAAEIHVLLVGSSLDASLDRGTLTAGPDGHAMLTLKAPSAPTSFHVVAQVVDAATGGTGSADLAVAVSDGGFGSVRVLPKYLGTRDLAGWQASVSVGASCASIKSQLPADPVGALMASAAPGGTPVVGSVPVGPKLAIAVRSGALAWGCVETTIATPSATRDVTLTVTDTPIRLDAANLALSLAYAPPALSYAQLLTKSKMEIVDASFPATGSLATWVVDAMRENVPAALLAAFDQHRQASAVDSVVAAGFSSSGVDPRARIQSWAALVGPAPAGSGLTLHGVLTGSKSAPTAPTFALDTFGPVAAADAGVHPSVTLTWMAQPGDTVVAGGKLAFSPTRLVGHLVEKQALLAIPSASNMAGALASQIDCDAVGTDAGGFPGCDATCGKALCVAAMSTLWERGLAAADGQGSVGIAISSSATVDASAAPASLDGSWVGSMTGLGATCAMTGTATALAVPTP